MVDMYKTIADFSDQSFLMAFVYSIVSAVPLFFAFALFIIWLFGGGASYFVILRFTNRKRFFHVAASFSFVCTILSLFFASMNNPDIGIEVLNSYWIGFYVLMTGLSYLGLSIYK